MSTERSPLEPLRTPYRLEYLSQAQLEQLQAATLDILENTGVRFPSDKALRVLADHGGPGGRTHASGEIPPRGCHESHVDHPAYFHHGCA